MRRASKLVGVLLLVSLLLALAVAPAAAARESLILRLTRLSDPGLIDVAVQSVTFDAATRAITVTGVVTCNAEAVDVYVVDFTATQARGGDTTRSDTYDDQITCGEVFVATIPSPAGSLFGPGPAQLTVSASACGFGCTVEVVRLDVVLLPG